jgi:hypothetical protein
MNTAENNQGLRVRAAWQARPSHLRLNCSGVVRPAPASKTLWTMSTVACPSRFALLANRKATPSKHIDNKGRPRSRREEEGTKMKTKESFVYSMGRFVFGLGIGFALTSVYVIVASGPDLLSGKPAASDVIHLDPVVVTISSKRFDEIYAEADLPAQKVHLYGAGARQV